MASGFERRFKGKVNFDNGPWLKGVKLTASGADLNVNTGWGTVGSAVSGTTMPNSGITQILSTALAVYQLAAPSPGVSKVIDIAAASSGWMVQVPTGVVILNGSTTAGGSTKANTITSTATLIASLVELYGLSTIAYAFAGVVPSTVGHLLFSTTT